MYNDSFLSRNFSSAKHTALGAARQAAAAWRVAIQAARACGHHPCRSTYWTCGNVCKREGELGGGQHFGVPQEARQLKQRDRAPGNKNRPHLWASVHIIILSVWVLGPPAASGASVALGVCRSNAARQDTPWENHAPKIACRSAMFRRNQSKLKAPRIEYAVTARNSPCQPLNLFKPPQ